MPLEVLSRGTREAVFIALRLSLAAAYSRRGATLPLVLDDVLVNFDTIRATSAAKVLRDFAALGHQVVMFTCHEHIMRMFDSIGVQVRVLPAQGEPGVAEIYRPDGLPKKSKAKMPEPAPEVVVVEPAEPILQEPEPLVLPARTRVLVSKEPEVTPSIKLIIEDSVAEPSTDSLPLWFEQEWVQTDWTDPTEIENDESLANASYLDDSNQIATKVWTQSENLPIPLPTDSAGLDGWWEDYAARTNQ